MSETVRQFESEFITRKDNTFHLEQRRQYEIPCDKMQTCGTLVKQVCVFLQNWFTEIILTNLS